MRFSLILLTAAASLVVISNGCPALTTEKPLSVKKDQQRASVADKDVKPVSTGPSNPSNPLDGQTMYVNPSFKRDISRSMSSSSEQLVRENLKIMRDTASAYWLDVKAKTPAGNDTTTATAEGILKDALTQRPVPLVSFMVYNLPNRDCHAKASNGEICCSAKRNPDGTCNYLDNTGNCAHGLADYKKNYIDEIAQSIRKYCDRVPMALFIEPDSLPNLVTNTDDPKCGGIATRTSYRVGVQYAVQSLSKACPSATIYLDGAHGGWLGWDNNRKGYATVIKALEIAHLIRGFSLNVANYQPLGVRCPSIGFCLNGANSDHECCKDPCGLSTAFNPAHNELNYAMSLRATMESVIPGFKPYMVIDTGRNGRSSRLQCGNWCNVRGAGTGVLPSTKTDYPEVVDAYMWLKTPGESDGCTERLPAGGICRRFDSDCASDNSIGTRHGEPRCPEAGGWFAYQILMLARNAKFAV